MIVPDIKKFVLLTLLVCATCTLQAQKQLVLLKREKVIMRFNPGDAIVISLKGKKQRIDSYINNLLTPLYPFTKLIEFIFHTLVW
jgi:hypothetical protein